MGEKQLLRTKQFNRSFRKISRQNDYVYKQVIATLHQLLEAPFHPGLRTHRINHSKYGQVYSSRVTGDLRIIWSFRYPNNVMTVHTLGGHSGSKKVYN